MGHLAELRGDTEAPVGTVIVRSLEAECAGAGIGVERQVIGRPHDTGGFAGRTRTVLELHRGFAGAACARALGREVLAVEFDVFADLGVGSKIHSGTWR